MDLLRKNRYYLSHFFAKPLIPPELLIISLTECCNLKCIICSIRKEIAKDNLEIDLNKIFEILSQAKDMKIETVVLSGGEPFLIKEIFEIAEHIHRLKMKTCVTTNGFYGDEVIQGIANSNIDHLHFSFDGLQESHDAIRGQGSYDRLLRSVNLLRQKKPHQSIGFGTVICSRNCADLFEMTKIADSLRVNTVNFIPFLINNTDPQHSKKGCNYSELWPSNQDLINLEVNFSKIANCRYQHLKIDLNPDFNLLMQYYSLRDIRRTCFAGYKSIIITSQRRHNGKIISDVFFCQDSCGNVYETTLKEAWTSEKARQMRLIAKKCQNSCLQFCHYI